MLILSSILGLASHQVDYIQVFPQAPLDDPVYMQIPQSWLFDPRQNGYDNTLILLFANQSFIKLKCNLYGCKQAACNWLLYLVKGLVAQGFHQPSVDPCLLLQHYCIIMIYTDDCCFFAINESVIEQVSVRNSIDKTRVQSLIIWALMLTKQIMLKQAGLIDSILCDLKLIA